MKKSTIIIILLLLVIVGGALKFVILGSTIKGEDNRTVILLDAGERNHILKEMRGLLGHMQQMITAISNDDMDTVIKISKTLVEDSGGATPATIIAKMPLSFKSLSNSIHGDFKQLYADSKEKRDSKLALKQVSKLMGNCIACHASHSLQPK